MDWLHQTTWSPYIAGVGIGILSGLTLLISNKSLSCSTTFAKTAGMIERQFRKNKTDLRPYYQKNKIEVDWQWMLIAGIFLGGLFSALLSGSFHFRIVDNWWTLFIGSDPSWRMFGALAGGICLGFGARWADGCTSGHGISGIIQLSISSIVAAICFFAGGIGTALLMIAAGGGGY